MSQPYGSWPSPYTPESIAIASPKLDAARFVGAEIWWSESVPAEGGRVAVRSSSGAEILPAPWSARSRVHEYGGGAWAADAAGTLFFVDAGDQRIYRLSPGGAPVALTDPGPAHGGLRLQHGRLLAVREDLTVEPHTRSIIDLPVDATGVVAPRVHASGPDFFAHPALSPDGARIAWVQWSGRRMPWQEAALRIARVGGGELVAPSTRAALQPEWVGADELVYSDDPTGRWTLHRLRLDGDSAGEPTPIAPADADIGYGLWVLGNRWYRPLPDGRIVAARTNGSDEIVVIGTDGAARRLDVPPSGHVSVDDVDGSRVLLTGGSTTHTPGVWLVDVDSGAVSAVRGGEPVDPAWMPPARPIAFDGARGTVHAFAYAPANPDASAPAGELPPYVVLVHGGPNAHVSGAASDTIAFYTSRGIGVLDVNYAGSTGYGRAYRERLDGAWGVADVDDVIAAAQGLAAAGIADPARIAIRGGSAGGWTVLCALVRGGVFGAGISRYGVTDLRALAADTHDFERYYLDGLVGPLPETESVYIERSPLSHADRIDVPVLLQQGAEDRVVPPAQSASIRDALAARGIPHEYVEYPDEGHGFRRAETIIDALRREIAFLGRVFGFEPTL